MNIGIIGAIEKEIKIIKKIIHNPINNTIGKFIIYEGTYKKNKIFLIKSGIGKVCASMATTILINTYQINIIINIGSTGGLKPFLNIGDIILPTEICYYDVDLKNFGYSIGQIPKYPKIFLTNIKLHKIIKDIAFSSKLKTSTGLIISGDSFVREDHLIKMINQNFPTAIGVDMEASAIAQVCYHFSIPFVIIKSISDLSNHYATLNFKKNISIAAFQSSKLLKLVFKKINFSNAFE